MEANEKDVIGEQHEAAEFIGNSALSKDIVSEITYLACECVGFGRRDGNISLQMSMI